MAVTPQDFYNRPKAEGDSDIIGLIRRCLSEYTSFLASDIFDKDDCINNAKKLKPEIQRYEVNNFLRYHLILFRNMESVTDTVELLSLLNNNSDESYWVQGITDYICPFLKEYKVLEKLYGVNYVK